MCELGILNQPVLCCFVLCNQVWMAGLQVGRCSSWVTKPETCAQSVRPMVLFIQVELLLDILVQGSVWQSGGEPKEMSPEQRRSSGIFTESQAWGWPKRCLISGHLVSPVASGSAQLSVQPAGWGESHGYNTMDGHKRTVILRDNTSQQIEA